MSAQTIYEFTARTIDSAERSLEDFRGQVLLVVNVASQCGFTPQYQGLETLQRKYQKQGFAVLGFPCNQFRHQEPGSETEIREFCSTRYEVTFPLFAKIEVNGPGAHPLYAWLKSSRPGLLGTESIKWNFTKFLVGRDGKVIGRFAPNATPESLVPAIEAQLAA